MNQLRTFRSMSLACGYNFEELPERLQRNGRRYILYVALSVLD